MKTMKYFMLAFVLVLQSAICEGREKVITVKELPAAAQTLLATHFKNHQVALVQKDHELTHIDYDVVFNNGTKLQFDSKGEWSEIDCKPAAVPEALVPKAISSYVKTTYPNVRIVQIERDRKGYEIELSNGLDIKFNNQFKVVEIDD